VTRDRRPVLLPDPLIARRIDAAADAAGADLVVLDPALPLGWVGPALDHPYAVVLHGAEVTVPARLITSTPGDRGRPYRASATRRNLAYASSQLCRGRSPCGPGRRVHDVHERRTGSPSAD
ncbi:MAG: hypothetical protein WKF75_21730, partial [Singulisphaera sp.]